MTKGNRQVMSEMETLQKTEMQAASGSGAGRPRQAEANRLLDSVEQLLEQRDAMKMDQMFITEDKRRT